MDVAVSFDVPAAMRDGAVLRANVFRPAEGRPYPVVLSRTPYGKDLAAVSPSLDALRLARAGYIVVLQDVRGRAASEGVWSPMRHEAADGYDSVEWAAALAGSSGRVGMVGNSYLGFTQWMAASQTPPHLKAIVPFTTWADARDGMSWRGGAMELGMGADWYLWTSFDTLYRRYANAPAAEQGAALGTLLYCVDHLRTEGYRSLPLKDFAPLVSSLGSLPELWANMLARPYAAAAAAPYSPRESHGRITVPVYNVGGWYDLFCGGTLANYRALREMGATPEARQSRLLMGPWAHTSFDRVLGERDFGFRAQLAWMDLQTDLTGLTQRWFDFWLKGIDNGVSGESPVRLFIMGDDVWRDEAAWPLARACPTPYYLRASGGLSPVPPGEEGPDRYTYDPRDPTPTRGGAHLMSPLYGIGPHDQRPLEARPDVLRYTSAPLESDVEVTGPVVATLWVASDAPDTDFVARLVDVHPDGLACCLCDGIIRARFRNGEAEELLEPGRAYELTIDLWSTANVFKAGHRIRLDVASASFPRWDRNPNTGHPIGADAELRPALQTILHDSSRPSRVLLPVVPR